MQPHHNHLLLQRPCVRTSAYAELLDIAIQPSLEHTDMGDRLHPPHYKLCDLCASTPFPVK